MTLYMYSFSPDIGRLTRLAARERLLPPGDDLGYALHAVFAATFGDKAPKPFALLAPGHVGGGLTGSLLAYGTQPLEELRAHSTAFADPGFSAVLDLECAAEKTMPDRFDTGARLGFRVRVRPMVRTGKSGADWVGTRPASGERDAFLARLDQHSDGGVVAGPRSPSALAVSRAQCYVEWVGTGLEKMGARLELANVDAFQFTRLFARNRAGTGQRNMSPNGPDATITGVLSVTNPEKFSEGLARGIGRFRAFGFGMLLLSPPRQ